ncbi:hypothetical protein [Dokdonella sp.]|uniref:hypothetical protein n=1 Tax=Dokdonella sp. TaxID=2291710 RepID=UPI003C698226
MLPAAAMAEVPVLDVFSVRLATYFTQLDTVARVEGSVIDSGTDIDLQRDLGLKSSEAIAFAQVDWRPWAHHGFGVSYFNNSRSSNRTLQRDIIFEGQDFPAGSRVRTELEMEGYEMHYVFWAWQKENWALGPRVGLVYYDIGLSLEVEQTTAVNRADANSGVPAPSIGFDWRWRPADDWRIYASAGVFNATINDVDGSVAVGQIGVEWFPWERFGVYLDYSRNKIDVNLDRRDYRGSLELDDSGARTGIIFRF